VNLRIPSTTPTVQIGTVLLCDLVDSTGLVERLGDAMSVDVMRRHDQLVRHLLRGHAGREIDKSDGFLALFEHPLQAVAFALNYQRELRALGNAEGWPLSARVGIHVGDVLLWESDAEDIARGAKALNVEGVAKPVAARLMQLARPGQILVSAVAEDLARRADAESSELDPRVHWHDWGRYALKGVPEPIGVHEVGELGLTPLRAPADTDKAHRERRGWKRRPVLLAQVITAFSMLAIVAMLGLRSDEAIAFRERDWVVIGSLDNRTGDTRFDDAIETALRISLEQSRHVNVLSDLRTRATLKYAGHDAGDRVDRAIGSEIAVREGARALLLPSLAEVGGKLRLNIEVVEPESRRTVYVEAAEGHGPASLLESLGQVSRALRDRLGETLQSIAENSAPLERVTSYSLDALRAYSLANKALSTADIVGAEQHFRQALTLDSEFALAWIGMARVQFSQNKLDLASESATRASAHAERLTQREHLYVQAWLALVERRRDYLDRWRALSDLYPDYYVAAHNVALFAWYANRFEESNRYAERAFASRSAVQVDAHYRLGIARLGLGNVDGAVSAFREALLLGYQGQGIVAAGAYAAAGRYADAHKALRVGAPGSPLVAHGRPLMRIAILLAEGKHAAAVELAHSLRGDGDEMPAAPVYRILREAAVLGMLSHHAPEQAGEWRRQLAGFVEQTAEATLALSGESREQAVMGLLYAGYLAAGSGETGLAHYAIEAGEPAIESSPLPVLRNMSAIVTARIAMSEGRNHEAVALLDEHINGQELYLTRAVAAAANAAIGNQKAVLEHVEWMTRYKGRAFAELSYSYALLIENVREAERAASGAMADELLARPQRRVANL
jgi:putative peptide modification system cyclase